MDANIFSSGNEHRSGRHRNGMELIKERVEHTQNGGPLSDAKEQRYLECTSTDPARCQDRSIEVVYMGHSPLMAVKVDI